MSEQTENNLTATPGALLDSFTWLTDAREQLSQQFSAAKLSHAILLNSPEGQGKALFAEHFAGVLLCQRQSACGQCKSCQLLKGHHPDLMSVTPQLPSKRIRIGQIRQVTEFMTLAPHTAPVKVVVIANIDRMNRESANALLKLLEEPPKDRYLLMTTSHLGLLLPTIRSRVSLVRLSSPEEAEARAFLSAYLQNQAIQARDEAEQAATNQANQKASTAKRAKAAVKPTYKLDDFLTTYSATQYDQAFRRYPNAPLSALVYMQQSGSEVEKLILKWFYAQFVTGNIANFPALPSLEKSAADPLTIQQQILAYTLTVLNGLIDISTGKLEPSQHKAVNALLSRVTLQTLMRIKREVDLISTQLGQVTVTNAIAAIVQQHALKQAA